MDQEATINWTLGAGQVSNKQDCRQQSRGGIYVSSITFLMAFSFSQA